MRARQRLVGQATAIGTLERGYGTVGIVSPASVETEHLLVNVGRKVAVARGPI